MPQATQFERATDALKSEASEARSRAKVTDRIIDFTDFFGRILGNHPDNCMTNPVNVTVVNGHHVEKIRALRPMPAIDGDKEHFSIVESVRRLPGSKTDIHLLQTDIMVYEDGEPHGIWDDGEGVSLASLNTGIRPEINELWTPTHVVRNQADLGRLIVVTNGILALHGIEAYDISRIE
jgi:hypothetical protein